MSRVEVRGRPVKFLLLLSAAALLLALLVAAAFVLPPPWSWAVGFVYVGYDTWLLGSMVLAARRAVNAPAPSPVAGPRPTLAVLIAARNEREALPATLRAALAQTEPAERVLVIDDGSDDGTEALLTSLYALQPEGDLEVKLEGSLKVSAREPRLQLLRKPNSGKARSLNLALGLLDEELVVTLDADTSLEPEALARVRDAFLREPQLTAACGVLRPTTRPAAGSALFELYQRFEYLRSFLWRLAWMRDDTLVLVSGAFAIFRRAPLVQAGGFDPRSLVEDYELLFRMHRRSLAGGQPLRVAVIDGARATTDAPGDVRTFLRQRARWFGGFIDTMFTHGDMVLDRRYGRLGRVHLVVKTLDTLLPLYGLCAFVALLSFLASGKRIDSVILGALIAKFVYDLSCHFACVLLHERWQRQAPSAGFRLRAFFATLTEPFGFQLLRQAAAALGWVAFLRGRLEWHPQRESPARSHAPGLEA